MITRLLESIRWWWALREFKQVTWKGVLMCHILMALAAWATYNVLPKDPGLCVTICDDGDPAKLSYPYSTD